MWSSRNALIVIGSSCLAVGQVSIAAVDLATLEIAPQRGQSADQLRRDRYECHNWAVDETSSLPAAASTPQRGTDKAERTGRILNGAAIGAALGGLIRSVQRKDPSNGVLAGAAVGAAVGAATGRAKEPAVSAAEDDYLRALSACLEGRGYRVALPARTDEGRVAANTR